MGKSLPKLITPGVIANRLGVALHRVLYILYSRPHIMPAARAGTLRLYPERSIALVRHELNAIDARRHRGTFPVDHHFNEFQERDGAI